MNTSQWFLVGSVACIGLGLAGGWMVFRLRRQNAEFAKRAVSTVGTVVGLEPSGEGEIAPRYAFTTPDGRARTALSPVSYYPARHTVGQSVEVLFDPVTEETRLKGWLENRGSEVVLAILSVAVFSIGVCGAFILLG